MKAGRELDALVTETVFELRRVEGADVPQKHYALDIADQVAWVDAEGQHVYCKTCGDMPPHSTDIAAGQQVLKHICEAAPPNIMRKCELHWFPAEKEGRVCCRIIDFDMSNGGEAVKDWEAYGETIEEAWCLAALAVMGVEVPPHGE